MSIWSIYRRSGGAPRLVASCDTLEYHDEWMGDSFVTVTVKSAEPIDFQIGDYVEYRNGEMFSVNYDPNIIKKACSGSYGEGFVYENVRLYPDSVRLKEIEFKDVVLNTLQDNANKLVYSSMATFSFFASSVEDLADRIQANLNRVESGVWTVLTPNRPRSIQRKSSAAGQWGDWYEGDGTAIIGKTDVNISADGLYCWDALKLSYTAFDLSFFVSGTTIIIGGKAIASDHDFRYGKGLGLYQIERTFDDSQKIVTKLFSYGSERNLPTNYYANLHKKPYVTGHKETWQIIMDEPIYSLLTDIQWETVSGKVERNQYVTVSDGTVKCTAWLDYRGLGADYDDKYFRVNFMGDGAEAFYNRISDGQMIFFVTGVNVNTWPYVYNSAEGHDNYPALLSINRLMLPGFPDESIYAWVLAHGGTPVDAPLNDSKTGAATWKNMTAYFSKDKTDPWLMSRNAEKIGIREGSLNFSDGDDEIYPTIEGSGYDEVNWAEQMDDNGYLDGDDATFKMMPQQPDGDDGGIEWNYSVDTVSVSMKDGYCVGREFKVSKAARNDVGLWELTLERAKDESLGVSFPYKYGNSGLYQVIGRGNTYGHAQGDKFVVLGIPLPQRFVEIAASKLLERSLQELSKKDHQQFTYVPKIDEIYMKRQDDAVKEERDADTYGTVSLHDTLHAGMQMVMSDEDLNLDGYRPFIDTLTIKEDGNNGIPTYDVVLRDEKELTMSERIQSQIEGGMSGIINVSGGGGGLSEAEVARVGRDLFLSKTEEDSTEFLISFFGGLIYDQFLKSADYAPGEWIDIIDGDGEVIGHRHTGNGAGFIKNGNVWSMEVDEAVVRLLLRAKEIYTDTAHIGEVTNQTIFRAGLKALGNIILGNYVEGRDPSEQEGGKLTPDGYADLNSLLARVMATIGTGLITEQSEGVDVRKPSLTVNGDSAFSDWLSSFDFITGFLTGKGWAIRSHEYINPAGQRETKWSLEIDNVTVRNILRVYELVVSQLRGENDNYIFAAMMEVHHYDIETGRVWLSTEGGKIYMPFRRGDCIMVQRYQPGNDYKSGGDGYITKQYEMVITAVGSGGETDVKDENGDRLDWVEFTNFTTQMTHDDPQHTPYTPEECIAKQDTFCRVDNLYDPERKGIVQIMSVGPDTPYMDVAYGLKTDPNNALKTRIGNLAGIRSDYFGGWLSGYGVYDINNYSIGTFVNKQTGERYDSRISATNTSMRVSYKETLYDISDDDNKVINGFFQNELTDWDEVHVDGTPLTSSEIAERERQDCVSVDGNSIPLLMNGQVMQFSRTVYYAELSTVDGVQVLHLSNRGVSQDYVVMKENGTHKTLDDVDGTTPMPEYDKATRVYWEEYYRKDIISQLEAHGIVWDDYMVEQYLQREDFQRAIDNAVATYSSQNTQREEAYTDTDEIADRLYCGIRILPLTAGDLVMRFKPTSGSRTTQTRTQHLSASLEWQIVEFSDDPETGEVWDYKPSGNFIVSYSGECYIRFIALSNDPISDSKAEYDTLFEINSRHIQLQARRIDNQGTRLASIEIKYDKISMLVTENDEKTKGWVDNLQKELDDEEAARTNFENVTFVSYQQQTAGQIASVVAALTVDGNIMSMSSMKQYADSIESEVESYADDAVSDLRTKVNGDISTINTNMGNLDTKINNVDKKNDDREAAYATWKSQTDTTISTIAGKWDAQGNLIGYSTTQQTADAISSAVGDGVTTAKSYTDALKALINTDVLKDKSGNYAYITFKNQTTTDIQNLAAKFDSDGGLVAWSSFKQDAESIISEVETARGSYASLKLHLDAIESTVTNNKTAADNAINTINNTTIPGINNSITNVSNRVTPLETWKTNSKTDYDNSATWVSQNKDKYSAIAGKFDDDGNPTAASGIVVSTGSGATSFATLFASNYSTTYIDPSEFEQGYFKVTSSGMDVIKSDASASFPDHSVCIRTADYQRVPSGLNFYLNKGFELHVLYFTSNKAYITSYQSNSDKEGNRGITVPANAAYCYVYIKYSAAITPKQLASTGFKMSDTKDVTRAEISVFVDDFGTSNAKIKANQIKITTVEQINFTDNDDWGELASKLDGEIQITAGQITNFATAWKAQADSFIVNANNISFSAENVTWKIDKLWTINNKNNDTTMLFDQYGNLTITGTLNSGSVINTAATIDGYQAGSTMLGHKINQITFPTSGDGNVYPTPKNHGLTHVIISAAKGGTKFINLPTLGECKTALGISSGSFCIRMVFMNQSNTSSSTVQGDLIYIRGRDGNAVENVSSDTVRPYVVNSSDVGNFQLTYSRIAEVFIVRFNTRFVATYLIS